MSGSGAVAGAEISAPPGEAGVSASRGAERAEILAPPGAGAEISASRGAEDVN